MTPSELKQWYLDKHPSGLFFSRKTLKFFGDTMHNYGVRSAGDYWCLYRKRPVKHGIQTPHYFNKITFEHTTTPPEVNHG